jgi:uncharacterized membrane protein YkoI
MRRFLPVYLALPLALMAGQTSLAASRCINDWSQAAPIVRQEKLLTVEQLTAAARGRIEGDIVKTTLCQDDGNWVFRLIVRVKGHLEMMTVDAKDPFPR